MADENAARLLGLALDVRRGFKRFVDIAAIDRPLVVQQMRKLSDAKMQELLGGQRKHGGNGTFSGSRVG